MKQFNGYDDAKKSAEYKGSSQIPVGAYVCKVQGVKLEPGTDGNSDAIAIRFDVAEGEYKDFFKTQYEQNSSDDRKWKGATRIYCPKDDGSEQDGWTKNAFARWTKAFEDSNSGYSWDWDENKWKNKYIGLIFGPTGTVINGKEVLYNEMHRPCSVTEVKEGTFYQKALELKKKKGYTGDKHGFNSASNSNDEFMNIPVGVDEEVPF